MAYCSNCGQQYTLADSYCSNCGRQVRPAPVQVRTEVHDDYLASSIEKALERTDDRRRMRRNSAEGSNEGMRLYIGCIAIIALFHGLALMGGSGFMKLLDGPLGLMMLAGIALGVLFKVIFDMRLGYSLGRSLIETLLLGALVYGLMYGFFWYFSETFIHSGKPLITLPGVSTPTPKA